MTAAPAAAQAPLDIPEDLPVSLVADEMVYDSVNQRLTARGGVEVFYGDRTLTADQIVYERRADRITADGRIVVRDPSGATFYADFAELDPRLQDGLIRSARAVMARRFKLAAVEAERIDGRYNVLGKAVFSTCTVCAESPTPAWRIRADRIVHDEIEHVIHYEDATFDVAGVPVAYLPYFRHPDPTVDRMSGFLVPEFLSSNVYGYAVKVPYYWVIDESSDLTLTPFITSDKGLIVEGEYRKAFDRGYLELGGSGTYSNDVDTRPLRGFVEGEGYQYLSDTIFGRFQLEAVSDDGYLANYDYSDDDRLTSFAEIASFRNEGYWTIGGSYFQSLRDDESSGQVPIALPEFDLRQNLYAGDQGRVSLTLNSVGLKRTEGLDMWRLTGAMNWEKTFITEEGLSIRPFGEARVDTFRVWDSTEFDNTLESRVMPTVGVDLRYPLIRVSAASSTIIEPIAQLIWSEPYGVRQDQIPNEDSTLVEFDETNLFSASRFPGYDRVESGFRANLGMRYERVDADGWTLGAVVGRVLRPNKDGAFRDVPGLAQQNSDYVGAVNVNLPPYLNVVNRMLLNENFEFDRYEFRLDTNYADLALSGSYIRLARDEQAGAFERRSEAAVEASYQLDPNWQIGGVMRYDLTYSEWVRAGAGLTYGNDCYEISFSVNRRFTNSQDVDASTSVALQVRLAGLGSDLSSSRRADSCRLLTR